MKTLFNSILLSIFGLFFAQTVSGNEPITISNAVSRALEHNYSIRIRQLNQQVAETNNSWGAAGRLPYVDLALVSNNRNTYANSGDTRTNTITPEVNLNWVLFNGFAIGITKEKLDNLERLSKGNTVVLVEQTIQSVITAYYRALFEREKLRVLEEVMNLSKDRYDYIITRKEIGSAVTYDVLQAQNAWLEDKTVVMSQEVTVRNAVRDLNYLMGESGEKAYEFMDEFAASLQEYTWQDISGKMMERNSTLQNQYISMMILEQDIRLAKSEYYPTLSLRSGVERVNTRIKPEGVDPTTNRSAGLYANLTLSLPLFDGGARNRALKIAKIQEKAGKIETEELEHSLLNELEKVHDLYNVRKDLYIVSEENLDAAKLNLDISGERFRAGIINSFNYRDVQLIYENAALRRLQSIYNLIETDTVLLRLTGGILTELDNE